MTRLSQGLVIIGLVLVASALLRALTDDSPHIRSAPNSLAAEADLPTSAPPVVSLPVAEFTKVARIQDKPGPKVAVISRDWTPIPHYPNASLALAALRPMAEQGDTKAMIGIARSLAPCLVQPLSEGDKRWSHAYAARSGGDDVYSDSEWDHKLAVGFNRYCTVNRGEVFSEYRHWLLRAADAGDSEAQTLASVFPPFDPDTREKAKAQIDRGDESGYDFLSGGARDLALKYARLAAAQGEVCAVTMARIHMLHLPEGERDPGELFLFSKVLSQIPKADGSRQTWDRTLEVEGKALRDIDRELMIEKSHEMLAEPTQWIWRPLPSMGFDWAAPLPL